MSTPRRRGDPLGKQALFWRPASPEDAAPDEAALLERGPVKVECPSCRAVSRIGLLDLTMFSMPAPVWVPKGRFSHWMTCPACRRRVWASVSLRPQR
jgi:hypothetical protein